MVKIAKLEVVYVFNYLCCRILKVCFPAFWVMKRQGKCTTPFSLYNVKFFEIYLSSEEITNYKAILSLIKSER